MQLKVKNGHMHKAYAKTKNRNKHNVLIENLILNIAIFMEHASSVHGYMNTRLLPAVAL